MPTSAGNPTETTPLLQDPSTAQANANGHEAYQTISPAIAEADDVNVDPDLEGHPGINGNNVDGNDQMYNGLPAIRAKMHFIFPAVAIGVFLAAADQTIIVSSYAKIGSDLSALNKTSWIASSYFLTLTTFQPLYGKLSDIFGRKACLLFAYAVFGIGCLICGLARNIDELIWARAFSGVGGSGMTTVVSIMLSDIIPLRERGTWQGYINIVYATGSASGAPLGGIIADSISWRWAFLAQVPFCVAAFLAVMWFLDEIPILKPSLILEQEETWRSKMKRVDFIGAFTLLCAVGTLILALDLGSNSTKLTWSSPLTLGILFLSLALFTAFVLVEKFIASEPFAPGNIIFAGQFVAAYLCNFFSFGGWLAALFYIPLFFQAYHGLSATQASLLLIPCIVCGVSGSLFAGKYMQYTGKYYKLTIACYTSLVIGMLLITISSSHLVPFRYQIPGMVLGMMTCAFSNGIGVTSSLIGLLANASAENQAVATACSYLFRSLGSVFGVAISATAVNQTLKTLLREKLKDVGGDLDPDRIAEMVRRSLAALKELPPEVRTVVRECYATGTQVAFSVEVVIVLGAAIAAWFIKEKALSR